MWISFTSQNGETVYIRHENIDVVEGLPSEGPVIIGEEKPKGGAAIFMISGTNLFVQEPSAEVMETIIAADNWQPDEEEELDEEPEPEEEG